MISDERCSKNLIEKKLKELGRDCLSWINNLGEKKKSEGQGRERWLIKEEIL